LGANDWRGEGGSLHVSMPDAGDPLYEAMIQAGGRAGLTVVDDVNGPHGGGVIGYMPRTIHRGRRWSSARAFLDPVRKRPNLTIFTGTQVEKILFEGARAVGVQCSG